MWLVLCDRRDDAALWAYAALRRRGVGPLELVTAEALAYSTHWVHRVGDDGASFEVRLADGRALRSEEVRGALNRLVSVPAEHMAGAAPAERAYGEAELQAFFLSWLEALPGPVLNRPCGQGPAGPWLHEPEWLVLAAAAGLPTEPYRWSGPRVRPWQRTAIVIDGAVAPAEMPPPIAASCRRLAESAGCRLLGVGFATGAGGAPVFAGASPVPDLRAGGDEVADLLAEALTTEAGTLVGAALRHSD